jgi:UDP-glucose 4-epimerase
MLLITGGLGFIGSHTARALLDAEQSCLVTRHRTSAIPEFLSADLGERLLVEPVDVDDADALAAAGAKHEITGIVHLADSAVERVLRRPGDLSPIALDRLFDGLGNVLHAAQSWSVRRVVIASTIGVYAGLPPGRLHEDSPLPCGPVHAIPTVKRCVELLAGFVADAFGVEVVFVRPSGIWGPGGRPASIFFGLPQIVHAAAGRTPLGRPVHAEDGIDLCYVKDCARAIAAVQTAPRLRHRIYNVGSGRVTTNAQALQAVERHVGPVDVDLLDGTTPGRPAGGQFLDVTRLTEETGFRPEYDLDAGVGEYLQWLSAGHDR